MKKLYRSRRDSKLFGLCGGLAELMNVDATLLRLVVVVTAFFSGGTVVLLYFIASMVIPREPVFDNPFGPGPMHPPGGFYPGGSSAFPNGGASRYAGPSAGFGQPPRQPNAQAQTQTSNLDEMMKDIEKKAMQKEIEELRAKLAKLEKGDE